MKPWKWAFKVPLPLPLSLCHWRMQTTPTSPVAAPDGNENFTQLLLIWKVWDKCADEMWISAWLPFRHWLLWFRHKGQYLHAPTVWLSLTKEWQVEIHLIVHQSMAPPSPGAKCPLCNFDGKWCCTWFHLAALTHFSQSGFDALPKSKMWNCAQRMPGFWRLWNVFKFYEPNSKPNNRIAFDFHERLRVRQITGEGNVIDLKPNSLRW